MLANTEAFDIAALMALAIWNSMAAIPLYLLRTFYLLTLNQYREVWEVGFSVLARSADMHLWEGPEVTSFPALALLVSNQSLGKPVHVL